MKHDLSIQNFYQTMKSVTSIRHLYQTMKPVTSKNIGRNRLKSRSKYMPHQGERECARRRRQMAKLEARRGAS